MISFLAPVVGAGSSGVKSTAQPPSKIFYICAVCVQSRETNSLLLIPYFGLFSNFVESLSEFEVMF